MAQANVPPNVLANGGVQAPVIIAQHPNVINLIAPHTLQAHEELVETVGVYTMQPFLRTYIGEFSRALVGDVIGMKYEISRLAMHNGLAGKHQVIFTLWQQQGGLRTSTLQQERVPFNNLQFPLHAMLLAA